LVHQTFLNQKKKLRKNTKELLGNNPYKEKQRFITPTQQQQQQQQQESKVRIFFCCD
jgi:hypothetical protein